MEFPKVQNEAEEVDPKYLVDETQQASISWLASQYREVYDEIEMRDEYIKKLKRAKKYLGEKLYDAMVASNMEKVTTEDGSFAPDLKEKVSVASGMQEDVFEYLEEIGHGDCVKRSVHFQTLNKLFREGKLADANEDLFKRWEEKAIRIRRS